MFSDLGVKEEPVAEKESGQVVEVENEEEELEDNSKSTNHPIIKMFHRAAIEGELSSVTSVDFPSLIAELARSRKKIERFVSARARKVL